MHLAPGTVFANDYQVLRELSAGGMGTLYVVLQKSTGKQRALKLMLPQMVSDPGLRRRFEQEAKIGALIESDHVVEVVGAGIDEASGAPWLAMELLKGEELTAQAVLNAPGPLTMLQAIMRQICHAVGAAHRAGIVHRDLKPANVFLAEAKRAGETREVKVLDFGIAKIAAEAATQHTAALGSPSWMAPEQSDKGTITAAADVWSLALIAYYLLTGKYFWVAAEDPNGTVHQVMKEVLFDPIPLASQRAAEQGAPKLPPWFDAWFSHCLVRQASLRYPDANAAYAAFENAIGGKHISLLPPTMSPMTAPMAPLVGASPQTPGASASALAPLLGASPQTPGASASALAPFVGASPQTPGAAARSSGHYPSGPPAPITPAVGPGQTQMGAGMTRVETPPAARRRWVAPLVGLLAVAGVITFAWRQRYGRPYVEPARPLVEVPSATAEPPDDEEDDVDPAPPLASGDAAAPKKKKKKVAGARSAGPSLSSALEQLASAKTPAGPKSDFDRAGAVLALNAVDVQKCATPDGPKGPNRLSVIYGNDGVPLQVYYDRRGPYRGTPTAECITQQLRTAKVAPFTGAQQAVTLPIELH